MAYDDRRSRFETICPVVRSERVRFERICDVSGGLGIREVVSFEAEILWVRRSETVTVLVDETGGTVREGSKYNDFYGLFTSVQDPLQGEAAEMARRFDVRPDGRLSVVVRTSVSDTPVVVDAARPDGAFSGTKAYVGIPVDWCRAPCGPLAEWSALNAAGDERRFQVEIPYVGTHRHPDVVLLDTRLRPDIHDQAMGAPVLLAPFLEGLTGSEADRARRGLAALATALRAEAAPAG
jgi:hypothetical protein